MIFPPPHANACTGHNFVTNTPIKFIFARAIEGPDYKNLMIFVISREIKQSCVLIWNDEKCDRKWFLVIQNGRRQPFC